MKSFGGWQFPDHEEHLQGWMRKVNDISFGRQRYQGKKQIAALGFCRARRVAVDIGAHIGLWSFYLARQFETVHAFEPVMAHRECFRANVTAANVTLHECALGEEDGAISMHTTTGSSGDSWVSGAGDIPLRRLDDLALENVDLIKLDCEGGELRALRGAEDTLKRCRPCVIVEQKPGKAQQFGFRETEAVDYLRSLGAVQRAVMSGDYILTCDA
jgi:FkbM family methyltransferase